MKRHLIALAAAVAVVSALMPSTPVSRLQAASAAGAPDPETIVPTVVVHYPGSSTTIARGINSRGDIVGTYNCVASPSCTLTGNEATAGSHGFLFRDGVYTRIDAGANTVVRGISEQGRIVGHYVVAGVTQGFVYSDGDFDPVVVPSELFDDPGATLRHTLPVRISPQGDIVGCFHEANLTMTTMHGWMSRNGKFTALMTPHSPGDTTSRDPDTMNNGISPNGEIVGFYLTDGVSYVADKTGIQYTFTLDDRFTLAWDVNARGDIVGVVGENAAYTGGSATKPRGFIRNKHGEYRTFEVQGGSNAQVFGINANRDIVGQYTDVLTGRTSGFVYRVQ